MKNSTVTLTIFIAIYIFQFAPIAEGENMATEHISMITTPVILLKGDKQILQGTGFYYQLEEKPNKVMFFLVTNYHVLTGYPPGENLPPKGDNIIFYFHRDDKKPGDIKQVRIPLFAKNGKPIWLNSKECPSADIAMIPIPSVLSKDVKVFCINEKWAEATIKIRPTSAIALVGYPYGYYDTKNWLPIWKTGSVASEYDFNFEGKPLFLIDISAFPGMSGSPAFAIANGIYEKVNGGAMAGWSRDFLGIYASMEMLKEKKYIEELTFESKSGMIVDQSLELGHIWKASLIINIARTFDLVKYENDISEDLTTKENNIKMEPSRKGML